MIRHYLTFAHQAAVLDEALVGWTLAECWSQEKNRLALHFVRGRDSLFVDISVDLRLGYALISRDLHRARKNTIDFFHELLGARVAGASIDDGERVIRLHFENGRALSIFFFGPGSGNVIAVAEGAVIGTFQSYAGEYDAILDGSDSEPHRGRVEIRELLRGSDDAAPRALARAIPAAGARIIREALERSGVRVNGLLRDRSDAELDAILDAVDRVYAACEASGEYSLYYLPNEVVFSLCEMETLAREAEKVEVFDDIARAVRTYRSGAFGIRRYADLRARLLKRAEKERGRLERAVAQAGTPEDHAARAAEGELCGSLILAHLPEIPAGRDRVMLTDFEGREREVRMDPKLTPVENAERYFRRARGARTAIETAAQEREELAKGLQAAVEMVAAIERAATVPELETIEANNRELFKMDAEPKEPGSAERYRRFVVPGGHEIYVGKNAANNDELTVRFARPNDYWFHARGTSGSHVVLRWSDAKSKPPKEAIRYAASLAAYYSGARNARMVPVAYTLKKYVRKPKGAAPGSVVMEREEVVMAEPRLPDDLT